MIISVSRALQEREVSKQMRNEGTTFDHNLVPRAFRSFFEGKALGTRLLCPAIYSTFVLNTLTLK